MRWNAHVKETACNSKRTVYKERVMATEGKVLTERARTGKSM